MDRATGARNLVAALVKAEQIEVRRAELLGRDLAQRIDNGPMLSAEELAAWLEQHKQVTELYAPTSLLAELIERYLNPSPAVVHVEARHPELEAALREGPDVPEPYMVYADWLQVQSDPLGELIALGVAATEGGEDDEIRFENFLEQHDDRFLAKLSSKLVDRIGLSWRYGLVRAIDEHYESLRSVSRPTPELWDEVLRLRVCELAQSLHVREPMTAPLAEAIAGAAPPWIRSLSIDVTGHFILGTGFVPRALLERPLDTLALWCQHLEAPFRPELLSPSLRRLELHLSAFKVERPVRFEGTELHLACSNLVQTVVAFELPNVQRLTVDLSGASAADVVEMLARVRLPSLTELAIDNGTIDRSLLDRLAKLPVALTSLGLTNLGLGDEHLRAFPELPALATLDVSGNVLTEGALDRLRERGVAVISHFQHQPGNERERQIRRIAGSRLHAAERLATPAAWKRTGVHGQIYWGRIRDDGEHELFVTSNLSQYGCSCRSHVHPCTHVAALALLAERTRLVPGPSDGIEKRVYARTVYL